MWLGVLHAESSKRLAPPLDVAWGVAVCMIIAYSMRAYRVGVWFCFVRFALLLAVVLTWDDCCFDSGLLLGLLCLLCVTQSAVPHTHIGTTHVCMRC